MQGERLEIACRDGVVLGGTWWQPLSRAPSGAVVIAGATGVTERYYHRYAAFLATHGFAALTFDYRGIGLSRPPDLRHCRYSWTQWGEQDVDAALRHAAGRAADIPLLLVGHSIGGFLPGYAEHAAHLSRMLTVGAQFAFWRDYARAERLGFLVKWHLVMPMLTVGFGYFPGQRLGWLEDLPADVAYEWAFRRSRIEAGLPKERATALANRFQRATAEVLAVSVDDDPFATRQAVRRALAYYSNARSHKIMLSPRDVGFDKVGHFELFHDRHASGFWLDTLLWLRDGRNPWPHRVFD